MTAQTSPSVVDLGDSKSLLKQLWKTHSRQLVDVVTVNEAKEQPSTNAANFAHRVEAFVTAVLQHRQNNNIRFIKNNSTSLTNFLRSAVLKDGIPSISPGRHVLRIDLKEFLAEMNHFECKGEEPTPEFIGQQSFGAFLYHMASDALRSAACGMALALLKPLSLTTRKNSDPTAWAFRFVNQTQLIVQFIHVEPVVPMVDVKTGLVGKFLTIRGHVTKARPKRLRIATADFVCGSCGAVVSHAFTLGRYSVPTKCGNSTCKSRTFGLHRSSTRYRNLQELRLQEAPDDCQQQAGRTPRQLMVEMTDERVNSCRPGDLVQVACTVQAVNTAVAQGWRGKRAQESSTYQLYLEGHSVTTLSDSRSGLSDRNNNATKDGTKKTGSSSSNSVAYTSQQLEAITKLCHADHRMFGLPERRAFPFDLLVRSLCPSIIGHDKVKAGLLLCLLGGTSGNNYSPTERTTSIRSNSHMLIVGDPGMGKSQMLLAASQLAARSVYVGGNTSSTTGLTVTLTKEEGGESGIEAGALVLADQGVCCIDEFDKMASSHQDGLLEAMEQQQVSIAKAGVVASLPARCSLVAAANPRHGSYSCDKTVAENLNMAKPILSRFDLVFILRDRADKELDRLVSSNIMNLYRKQNGNTVEAQNSQQAHQKSTHSTEGRVPLGERLAWVNTFQKEPLPADLVRDYIAYAREYCQPKLTPQAASILQRYYMSLRYPETGIRKQDTVPITTRQLEALIRLCQARAKACLRDFCLEEDALDVVELMQASVEQVHMDESGVCDPIRGGAGGQSNRKRKRVFVQRLQSVIGVGAECSLDDLRRVADQTKVGLNEFNPLIEELRNSGVLMKKSNGNYQIL